MIVAIVLGVSVVLIVVLGCIPLYIQKSNNLNSIGLYGENINLFSNSNNDLFNYSDTTSTRQSITTTSTTNAIRTIYYWPICPNSLVNVNDSDYNMIILRGVQFAEGLNSTTNGSIHLTNGSLFIRRDNHLSDSFTISAWFRLPNFVTNANATFIDFRGIFSTFQVYLSSGTDGRPWIFMQDAANTLTLQSSASLTASSTVWNHLVITYDSTVEFENNVKIYLNNVLTASGYILNFAFGDYVGTSLALFGNFNNSTGLNNYFLDEIIITDGAWNATNVNAEYNGDVFNCP